MSISFYDYCIANQQQKLLEEWNSEKNRPLLSKQITYGSNKKVWWRCGDGHEWEASVKSRTSGYNCPVCSRRVIVPGVNDLAATHPELAMQWHPQKNGTLIPNQVSAGTRRKIWWVCEKGHEWNASVASRAGYGIGCPICTGKTIISGINDLKTMYPDIAAQWHPVKNGTKEPKDVAPYSNRKFWWICEYGHEYSAEVRARTNRGSACPFCSNRKVLPGFNDLATMEPQIAAQWNAALNGELTPQMVTAGSHKKVWWQCAEGHIWKAVIGSRTGKQKCGCPVCAGKVQKSRNLRYGEIVAENKLGAK